MTPLIETVELAELAAGTAARGPCAVALGSFDGVHLGHLAIVKRTAEVARQSGEHSVAFTFDRLPLEVVQPERAPVLLTPHPRRLQLLGRYVDRVVVVRFDREFASLDPTRFVQDILVTGLQCRDAVAGFNYAFGKGASGTADSLRLAGSHFGFGVHIVAPVFCGSMQVSSTRIRHLVAQGRLEEAGELLGRPFSLEGNVVSGEGRGRHLGYPTANLAYDPRLALPAEGVYISEVWQHPESCTTTSGSQDGFLGRAVTAVSQRPTFGGRETTVESFILDYSGDLYGRALEVRFLYRLRGIVEFSGAGELRAQIEQDVAKARQYQRLARLQAKKGMVNLSSRALC